MLQREKLEVLSSNSTCLLSRSFMLHMKCRNSSQGYGRCGSWSGYFLGNSCQWECRRGWKNWKEIELKKIVWRMHTSLNFWNRRIGNFSFLPWGFSFNIPTFNLGSLSVRGICYLNEKVSRNGCIRIPSSCLFDPSLRHTRRLSFSPWRLRSTFLG